MKDQSGQTPREEDSASAATRKPYESPKLRVYGDVAAITRNAGMNGMVNDGGHGNNKTS